MCFYRVNVHNINKIVLVDVEAVV